MLYESHKQIAISWAFLGTMIIYIYGLTEINYYLALIIMVPFTKMGAVFPDIDHNWKYVKFKNPLTWVINKSISLTGGKHRSWQTHSLDISLLSVLTAFTLPSSLYEAEWISLVDKEVLSIILVSFNLGWLSHIFGDMLTSGKVRLTCLSNRKIGLVPRRLFGISFDTGSGWEDFINKVISYLNIPLGILALIFPEIL